MWTPIELAMFLILIMCGLPLICILGWPFVAWIKSKIMHTKFEDPFSGIGAW